MKTEQASKPETVEAPQEWFFTFGVAHRLFASEEDGKTIGDGISLDTWYVRIYGTFSGARATMLKTFGRAWSFQYAELPTLSPYIGKWHDLTPLLTKAQRGL